MKSSNVTQADDMCIFKKTFFICNKKKCHTSYVTKAIFQRTVERAFDKRSKMFYWIFLVCFSDSFGTSYSAMSARCNIWWWLHDSGDELNSKLNCLLAQSINNAWRERTSWMQSGFIVFLLMLFALMLFSLNTRYFPTRIFFSIILSPHRMYFLCMFIHETLSNTILWNNKMDYFIEDSSSYISIFPRVRIRRTFSI